MKDTGLILPGDPQFEQRPSGHILRNDEVVADTIQCCHGGEHFISVKGSGKKRIWCMKCNGVACGRPDHVECKHFLKKLEEYERGLRIALR